MLKIKTITPKILHVMADNQEELCSTFLRFSEFMESPEFAGKIFTLGQFRHWYAEKFGAYTFPTDWTGFNLTQESFVPFIRGLFDPLTAGEQQLVNWVKDRTDIYSVIGTYPGSDALEHEICHALWATNPEYKAECQVALKEMHYVDYDAVAKMVLDSGYGESVVEDEVHAYTCENRIWMQEKKGIVVNVETENWLRAIKAKYHKAQR